MEKCLLSRQRQWNSLSKQDQNLGQVLGLHLFEVGIKHIAF